MSNINDYPANLLQFVEQWPVDRVHALAISRITVPLKPVYCTDDSATRRDDATTLRHAKIRALCKAIKLQRRRRSVTREALFIISPAELSTQFRAEW